MDNKGFLRYTKLTLFFTIFVVFAGSFVKVTGSGMGCPDWPKCFGYLVPPMDKEQVEWQKNHEYQEGQMIIRDSTLFKAKTDFTTTDVFSLEHWEQFDEHSYSEYVPTHTIIEYINRLSSTLLGIAWLLMTINAFRSKKRKAINIVLSFIVGFLIGFEAWLGKLVVKGVLDPLDISYHMLAAFVIIIVLSFGYALNYKDSDFPLKKAFKRLQVFAFFYLLIQLVLGVVVRQTFDQFADSMRQDWVDMAGYKFLVHRSGSLIYVAAIIGSVFLVWKEKQKGFIWSNLRWIIIITILEVLSGVVMGYMDVPKFAQPVHVILSSCLLLVQGNLFFRTILSKKD